MHLFGIKAQGRMNWISSDYNASRNRRHKKSETRRVSLTNIGFPLSTHQPALEAVRRHELQSCLETMRPCSMTLTFWTLTFQRRRVALRDHGRLFPNCGPLPHC